VCARQGMNVNEQALSCVDSISIEREIIRRSINVERLSTKKFKLDKIVHETVRDILSFICTYVRCLH
jgi:hypothetical protein